MPTHHIIVTGKVQGVFFRASAKKMALASGLVGWVKNIANNVVEIMVTGDVDALETFERWCSTGPPQAIVENVSSSLVSKENFNSFRILK